MSQDSQKSKVVEHIKTEYGANPEFLWPDRYPSYAVFRSDALRVLRHTFAGKEIGMSLRSIRTFKDI